MKIVPHGPFNPRFEPSIFQSQVQCYYKLSYQEWETKQSNNLNMNDKIPVAFVKFWTADALLFRVILIPSFGPKCLILPPSFIKNQPIVI